MCVCSSDPLQSTTPHSPTHASWAANRTHPLSTWLHLLCVLCSAAAGKDVYIDIAGWHLFMRDMNAVPGFKMSQALATQLGPEVRRKGGGQRGGGGVVCVYMWWVGVCCKAVVSISALSIPHIAPLPCITTSSSSAAMNMSCPATARLYSIVCSSPVCLCVSSPPLCLISLIMVI